VDTNHRKWDEKLPQLVFAANIAVHDSTGYTPAMMMYGCELTAPGTVRSRLEPPLPEDAKTVPQLESLAPTRTNPREIQDRSKATKGCHRTTSQVLRPAQKGMETSDRAIHHEWEHPLSRAVDDFAGKLAPRYSGPYHVHKILSPVIVTLRDQNNRPVKTFHVKDLKDVDEQNKDRVYNKADRESDD